MAQMAAIHLEAAAIAAQIDAGKPLELAQCKRLLDDTAATPAGAEPPLVAAVNGGRDPQPRVVVISDGGNGSVLNPGLMENYLVNARRKGVVVLMPESRQVDKKRRCSGLPDDVSYDGNGFCGRVNYQPPDRAQPSTGKRSTAWTRRHRINTHRTIDTPLITGHEVQRVIPNPAPCPALKLSGFAVVAGGAATLTTPAAHSFSGGRNILNIQGLGGEPSLDGFYPVVKGKPNTESFEIKLPAAAFNRADDLEQLAQWGLITVSESHVLDQSWTLTHFMDTSQDNEAPAEQGTVVPAAGSTGDIQAAPDSANKHPQGIFQAMPRDTDSIWALATNGDLLGELAASNSLLPSISAPLPQLGREGVEAAIFQFGGQQQHQQQHQQQEPQQQQQQHQQTQQQQQQQQQQPQKECSGPAIGSSGRSVPQPEPQLGTGGHQVQSEGHFLRLKVGGPALAAGREGHRAQALVVQGDAAFEGELTVQGQSDTELKRLGLVAQQVREVLERHEAGGTNIVREDSQGMLSVDYSGLLVLSLVALKKVSSDAEETRAALGAMQLTYASRIEELAQQVASLRSGAKAEVSSAQSSVLAAPSQSTSGIQLVAEAVTGCSDDDDDASLAFLADTGDVEMSSSRSGEEEVDAATSSGGEPPAGQLAGLTEVQVAEWLMAKLGEQAGARKMYLKLASKLELSELWSIYQRTISAPTELTAAGDRPRSLGGHFIWRRSSLVPRMKKMAGVGPAPKALRGYQQRAVNRAATGDNMILVGPTGSGKTAIAIAHAEAMLRLNPAARVVFLAPTVPLVQQQTAVFLSWPSFESGMFHVTGSSSDNPVSARKWTAAFHVVVATPQLLLNVLEAGAAHFTQLVLLVLDECHHAQADHPMAKVRRHYHKSERKTQVIGLTASPASRATLDATYQDLRQLERTLHADIVVMDEKDAELLAAVPAIECEERIVDMAPVDADLGRVLGLCELEKLPSEVNALLEAGKWCNTAANWTVAAAAGLQAAASAESASSAGSSSMQPPGTATFAAAARHDATNALLLVRAAVSSLALVSDVGFEAAVRYLSQEYYHVAAKLAGGMGASCGMPLTCALLVQLAVGVEQANVLAGAYSLEAGALSRHPNFAALKDLLLSYTDQGSFHGIVFARTREAVRSLTSLIQASPELQFLEVYRFMGHGYRRQSGGGGGGMTSKEQRSVMEQFRAPGRRRLVSTSAGAEGIDVPRCELVVRYTATQTGRERVQSAGRARKIGSRFVEIVERNPAELAMVQKARLEADNMRTAVHSLSRMRI
ncbi:Endoribonuclease Dicer 1 [Chlorella vulgaris]